MNLLSNTPPDGDFVRYIEQLTAVPRTGGARSGPASTSPQTAAAASPAWPATDHGVQQALHGRDLAKLFTDTPWLTHLKWIAGGWIALQLFERVVPFAGYLFFPALIVYFAWAFRKVNRDSAGQLVSRLRALSEQAARTTAQAADHGRVAQAPAHMRAASDSSHQRPGQKVDAESARKRL